MTRRASGTDKPTGTSRRRVLQAAAGAAGGAMAASFGFPTVLRAANAPITIGLQTDLTGILAIYGYWYDKACKAAVDRINANGGIDGREVRYVVENTGSKVDTGVPVIEKLVKRENADFIIGSLHSGVAFGSSNLCQDLNTLYFPCAHSEEVTGKAGNKLVFRLCSNSASEGEAVVTPQLAADLGENWSIFYVDYSWGQSHANVWRDRLKGVGAAIASEVAMPLGTSDLVPYLARIDPSTEACFAALFASDAIGFIQQRRSLGLDFRLVGTHGLSTGIDPEVLKDAAGFLMPETLPMQLKHWDTPHHRLLRDAVGVDETGKEIGTDRWLTSAFYWVTWEYANLIKQAVEQAGWESREDNEKVIDYLQGLTLPESDDYPQGEKYIRPEDHQAFHKMLLMRITEDGLQETVRMLEPREYPATVDYTKS